MKTSRTTTKEERIRIVRECIANGNNYGECAIKYNVSYQQVYTWVKKYAELGEAGLEDRRGKRKAEQEPRSELEEMKIPAGKIFVMGDNRQNSSDSRSKSVGLVDIDSITGKAVFRLFPFSRIGGLY